MNLRLIWRKSLNVFMLTLTGVAALAVVSVLFLILGYLVWNGWKSLNLDFFTKLPVPVGEMGGGMANAIVGSLKLLLLAAVIGLPMGVMAGIYLAEFGGRTYGFTIRYVTDLLNGVPSIVIGIFVWSIVVAPMKTFSTFAGGVALAIMVIPITLRSSEAFLRAVPTSLREGAMALGASKWRTILTVVLPAARGGIITGMLLALARVAGETAPLLFTAFGNQFWSPGWKQPVASLPVMIYTYAISPYQDWHRQAWAAGLVLLAIVLIANIGTRIVLSRGGVRSV
ncbi:MAG TPA: phosphate ABC transporter permease PstA [Candidatus Binatia bacterium]|jgi:phosphate transport system permease protein|nr:phosphate ABC transporter permease PstA [Candidatus Binatia bacterium]